MIELMILSKILDSQSLDIIVKNGIQPDLFITEREKLDYILEHHRKYGNVPDKRVFGTVFVDFRMEDVTENDDYLIEKLREAYLYLRLQPILKAAVPILNTNVYAGFNYLQNEFEQLTGVIAPEVGNAYDLMAGAEDRKKDYDRRVEADGLLGISTGIALLDKYLHGWLEEDLVILFARTNKGKSWILLFFLTVAWKLGYKVLLYSGEMSRTVVGFRVDTLVEHFSNTGLMHGYKELGDEKKQEDYHAYIERIKSKSGFYVVTPKDFGGRKPTVTEMCALWDYYEADIMGIDQISLMEDERKGENKTIRYANISEDLFLASEKRQKPVIALAQANRDSEKDKKKKESTPELHEIEYSDAVGQNATRVLSMNVVDGILRLGIRKDRYGGAVGKDVLLEWDIDKGQVKPLLEVNDHFGEEGVEGAFENVF